MKICLGDALDEYENPQKDDTDGSDVEFVPPRDDEAVQAPNDHDEYLQDDNCPWPSQEDTKRLAQQAAEEYVSYLNSLPTPDA